MTKRTEAVGFIGLGVMGFPMAGHLSNNGYATTVFNRSLGKSEKWRAQHNGDIAHSPASMVENVMHVVSCVGNDDDLREITFGPHGAIPLMKPGSVFIDHTTTSATIARDIAERAAEYGVQFLDAPVSGGQAGAESGSLTVMCGGTDNAFDTAKPIINSYAKAVTLMGSAGSGQLTKMVNQICVAGLLQGLSEGLNFGMNAGLDMERVIDVISKGAAQSWQMENRASTMCREEFDFGFAVDWMRKDLGIVLDEAKSNQSQLPITSIIDSYYAELQNTGHNRSDTSSLIKLLAKDRKK